MKKTLAEPWQRFRTRTGGPRTGDALTQMRWPPLGLRSPREAVRRVRVAHVLYRWSRSGMELQLAAQLACNDVRRVASWIASSQAAERQTPELPEHVVVRAPSGGAARSTRGFETWLTNCLRGTATDVVHARGLWMLQAAMRAARRAGGLPVVFSFHGFDDATRKISWMRRERWRDALSQCAAIMTVCEAAREEFARVMEIPAARIEVVPNGVDVKHFQPTAERAAARERLGLAADATTLLCVGSLMRVKGYDLLIEAIARLPRARRPGSVVFVGTDCLSGELQRRAADRIADVNVRFAGPCEDVRPYYAAADGLVAPSRAEGMSNAILEAMACGLPVIATRVGGNAELVVHGETGWLVEREDVAGLAEAVSELMTHANDAGTRGGRGRVRVMHGFSLERAAERYAAIYERARNDDGVRRARAGRRATSCGDDVSGCGRFWDGMRFYAYGRAAWWHVLAATGAGPGDNVLLPDLICDVMVEPLEWLGIEPRFYRCDPLRATTGEEIAARMDGATRAVLATHYFGLVQPVAEVARTCRQRGVLFVEDMAHGFLTMDGGWRLGADADAVLYSFRKVLPLANGAGLRVNSVRLARMLDEHAVAWPAARRDGLRHWGKRVDRTILGGLAERCVDGLRGVLRSRTEVRRESARVGDASGMAESMVRCCESSRRALGAVDTEHIAQTRRNAFETLARRWRAEALPGEPLITALPEGWVPYAFPVRPRAGSTDMLQRQLAELGLRGEVWPKLHASAAAQVSARRWVLVRL